jgi:hypothetical protein
MSSPSSSKRWRWLLLAPLVPCAGVCGGALPCLPAWFTAGVLIPRCQDGEVLGHLRVQLAGLERGVSRPLIITPIGTYVEPGESFSRTAAMSRVSLSLQLRSPRGELTPLPVAEDPGWEGVGDSLQGSVTLPASLPDGDYTVLVEADTPIGPVTAEVPLQLYAPAKVHLLTDRPLYEPGQTILMRSVALREADLVPLSERPGRFRVTAPSGAVLMDEKAPLDGWGVAASTFPIDPEAPSGAYEVCWVSGLDSGCQSVDVAPFTLPRFEITASSLEPWWSPGQAMRAELRVRYASGAPVRSGAVSLRWRVEGPWPAPTAWLEGELPTSLTLDADGDLELSLPVVPEDLVEQSTLVADLVATDAAGESVNGQLRLLMSEDPIQIVAFSELGDGVAQNFNNRVYMRALRADGSPLPGVQLTVQKAWSAAEPPIVQTTDADGFALLQLDPGPPVSVLIPSQPIRPPPRPPPLQLVRVQQEGQPTARLDDQRALGDATPTLRGCAIYAQAGARRALRLRIGADGRVHSGEAGDDALGSCLRLGAAGLRFPIGGPRLLVAELQLHDPGLPQLRVETEDRSSSGVEAAFESALLSARRCFDIQTPAGALDADLLWSTRVGSRAIDWQLSPRHEGSSWTEAQQACVRAAAGQATLPDEARQAEVGLLRITGSSGAGRPESSASPATLRPGYELLVRAAEGETALGDTKLRLWPAAVPERRLRVDRPLAAPGDRVTIELLRGPDAVVELPKTLRLVHADGSHQEAEREDEARTFSFVLPADKTGWYSAQWGDAVARIYAADPRTLSLSLHPERTVAQPGETVGLRVEARRGDLPVAASVSLLGVDETLGQLRPLPGPSAQSGLRAAPQTQPLGPGLDGAALVAGAVRGEIAQQAVLLRVTEAPVRAALDRPIYDLYEKPTDPVPEQTRVFFEVLRRLHAEVRAWEQWAPKGEQLRPPVVAQLWVAARERCAAELAPCLDPFGRPLRLGDLPADQLALTDPRALSRGERLPEDMENWAAWVAHEDPR